MQGNPRPLLLKPAWAWPTHCEESCLLHLLLLLPLLRSKTRNRCRPRPRLSPKEHKKSKACKACTATQVLPYRVTRLSEGLFQVLKRDLQRGLRSWPLSVHLSAPPSTPSSEPKPHLAIQSNPATLMQAISLTSMHHLHLHQHLRPLNTPPTTIPTSVGLCDCRLDLVRNLASPHQRPSAERRSLHPF